MHHGIPSSSIGDIFRQLKAGIKTQIDWSFLLGKNYLKIEQADVPKNTDICVVVIIFDTDE